jgi:hypothetical protein
LGLTETTIVLITSFLVLLLFESAPGLAGEGGSHAEDREENSARASETRETARTTGIVIEWEISWTDHLIPADAMII